MSNTAAVCEGLSVVILAAGESRRLGRPKQLLHYKGSRLIERAVCCAKDVSPEVIVVLGAYGDSIAKVLTDQSVVLAHNLSWRDGLGSSIRTGIDSVSKTAQGVLLMLCDQAHVSSEHLRELVNRWRKQRQAVVASAYGGVEGVPAVFPRALFEQLKSLQGDQGARSLISQYRPIEVLPWELGAEDIDTEADYQRLCLGDRK